MKDLALTDKGMPALLVGAERYPLCFSVAGMKEWAEVEGKTFAEAVGGGWRTDELTETQLFTLLLVALKGGEARRQLFSPGEAHTITDPFVTALLEAMHPAETFAVLLAAWNTVPGGEPDPQTPNPHPGETSSD